MTLVYTGYNGKQKGNLKDLTLEFLTNGLRQQGYADEFKRAKGEETIQHMIDRIYVPRP